MEKSFTLKDFVMSPSEWLAFAGMSFVLAVAPGPDNLFVLTQSAVLGARAGLYVVLGLCGGLLVQTIAAALGLAIVIQEFPAVFWAIKIAGAAYLCYLAYMAWTHAEDVPGEGGALDLKPWQLVRRGVIMNITNPKVQIFFLAFFPQFVKPGTEGMALALQMIGQGAIFLIATVVVFSACALGAGVLASALRNPKWAGLLNRASAVLFLGLAVSALFA